LYTDSVLRRGDLITFRKGEKVYDNVQDRIASLDQEMVRIRSLPQSRACIFYDHGQRACRIYARRPLECRAFACWEPEGLIHIYDQGRVRRADLISEHSALAQVIAEHERLCPWSRIMELVALVAQDPDCFQAGELADMVHVDQGMRQGLRDRAGATERELEFILGRSLASVLPNLGLKVIRTGSGVRLQPCPAPTGQPTG
jgi:Fe-S-cluster containining protein